MIKHLPTYTDDELLEGCRTNNIRCQQRLFERHYGKMMSLCLRYCNNKEDAAELLNSGFLKVFLNIKNYQSKGSLEGWIRKIILNNILEIHRTNIRYKEVINFAETEPQIGIDDNIVSHLIAEDIINMLGRLPASSRIVFNLFAIEGYSHQEIADMLKISIGTSKWHVAFAREKMKKLINQEQLNESNYVKA